MDINIMEAMSIIPRSLISLLTLFFITKLIGKRQVSELSLFDYVIGISIGNFSAEMIINFEVQFIDGLIAIVIFGLVAYIYSVLSMKSMWFRRFTSGVPTVIIENGEILMDSMKKSNIDINDLLEQCRNMGYFDIAEISFAVMETNGQISILPKGMYKPVVVNDLNVKPEKEALSANIIIDGKILENNVKESGKSIKWLKDELKKQGYTKYDNILLATFKNGNISVYEKVMRKAKKVLE